MGPNPNGPRSVSCDRAIRYSGFFGVRSVGPVGDFLDFLEMWKISEELGNGRHGSWDPVLGLSFT